MFQLEDSARDISNQNLNGILISEVIAAFDRVEAEGSSLVTVHQENAMSLLFENFAIKQTHSAITVDDHNVCHHDKLSSLAL